MSERAHPHGTRRRVLEVEFDGVGSLVRGPGSRALIMGVTGRAPVWSSVRKGWSVQERTARDVVAAAEVRRYDIAIIRPATVYESPEPLHRANRRRAEPTKDQWLW